MNEQISSNLSLSISRNHRTVFSVDEIYYNTERGHLFRLAYNISHPKYVNPFHLTYTDNSITFLYITLTIKNVPKEISKMPR